MVTHHLNGNGSNLDFDLDSWRDATDMSLKPCGPESTILHDGRLLFNLEDQFGNQQHKMLYFGKLLHRGLLILEVISKDRPGVINQITDLAKNYECNLIACQGDLIRPRVPMIAWEDHLDESGDMDTWFASLGRYRLHQSTFMITGTHLGLRDFWNALDKIKDSPAYRDRICNYELRKFHAVGPDRMGILQDIANTLYENEVNIQTIASRVHFDFDPRKTSAAIQLLIEVPTNRLKHSTDLLKAIRNHLSCDWQMSDLLPVSHRP
jgi:glycine cleavage system regulatory protein